jgi:urea transport system permease protein
LRFILASPFGRIAVAVRENEVRASLLGYDPRKIKLGVFIIGGAIAGFAGALYVNWGAFVSPTIFALSLSAEIIIWITVGGLGTLVGPVIGCFIIQYLKTKIGSQQLFNSNLIFGAILIAFVLLLPRGLVPTLQMLIRKALPDRGAAPAANGASLGVADEPVGAE